MSLKPHRASRRRAGADPAAPATTLPPAISRRLDMQGFEQEPQARLALLTPWLRVVGATTALWALAATMLQSAAAFMLLAPLALSCTFTRVHPFDLPYQLVIRHLVRRPPLPPSPVPRRFGCAFSAMWAAATALALSHGHLLLGRTLGLIMVLSAGITATTLFCFPSWIWRRLERFRLVHLTRP